MERAALDRQHRRFKSRDVSRTPEQSCIGTKLRQHGVARWGAAGSTEYVIDVNVTGSTVRKADMQPRLEALRKICVLHLAGADARGFRHDGGARRFGKR